MRTFRVRRGHTFQDGVPVTIADLNAAALPVIEEDDASDIGSTDLADGAVHKQHVTPDQYFYAEDTTGAANAYVASPVPAVTALEDGIQIVFQAGAGDTNTGASTINVSGLGTVALTRINGADLLPGDVRAGGIYVCQYNADGYWVLLNPSNPDIRHVTVSAGTAPDYTLTSATGLELTALYNGARISFRVHETFASGTATLAVDGLSAKPIRKDSDAAIDPGDLRIHSIADVVYNATSGASGGWVLVNARPPVARQAIPGDSSFLRVRRTSDTAVSVKADSVLLFDSAANAWYRASSVDVSAAITSSGAGGLDTATEDPSTLYYVYLIWNGATLSTLLSESATAPTMPSGYTYRALVGAVYNDSGSNFAGTNTYGSKRTFVSGPVTMPTGDTTVVIEVPHQFGEMPAMFRWVIVNLTTDQGYAAGEEIPFDILMSSSGGAEWPLGQYANATDIGLSQGLWASDPPQVSKKSGGASYLGPITTTKWALKCYAEL